MWDSKLATLRREAGHALSYRRFVRGSVWARFATRALDRAERQAHRRHLSVAMRDQNVLASVYGEGGEEESPLPVWGDSTDSTEGWWNQIEKDEEYYDSSFIDRFEDLVDLYLP